MGSKLTQVEWEVQPMAETDSQEGEGEDLVGSRYPNENGQQMAVDQGLGFRDRGGNLVVSKGSVIK